MKTNELKSEFHKLIDRIEDENQLRTFFELLSAQVEPEDGQPLPELKTRLEQSLPSFEAGQFITHEEIKRRVRYKKQDEQAIVYFQRQAIKLIVNYITELGINSVYELNQVRGKKMLEEPLWKLTEIKGKYNVRYISRGVYELEQKFKQPVSASTGTWNEKTLVNHLGPCPDSRGWSKDKNYRCQHEHVNERNKIVGLILKNPQRCLEIVDQLLTGCVVLESEHKRLKSDEIAIDDLWIRYRKAGIDVWDRDTKSWTVKNNLPHLAQV